MAAAACEVSMMDVCSPGPLSATYQKDLMAISEDSYYYNQHMEVVECEEFISSFNNRDTFMLLPEELVYEIFCFLQGSDICNTVQKVCRGWRRLAKDDRLWCDLLLRSSNEEVVPEKPAFKTWKWLYQSKHLCVTNPDNLKGKEVVGRFECDEHIYEGDWKDCKAHGYGRKIWKNHKSESEQKEENDQNALLDEAAPAATAGALNPNQQAIPKKSAPKKKPVMPCYEGEWKEGKEHGTGKRIFEEDHYYYGDWKEGEREGDGFYHWPNKTFYEGEFKEGFRHGHGTYTWSEKAKYIGQWQKGIEHGKGIRTWADGDRYEGDWVHGTRTGHGTYTWPNGSAYEGKWLQCAHEGYGVYKWPDGRVYKGHFMNNKKHGYGEYCWPDGAFYAGQWKSGVRHGEGTIVWPDSSKFVGEWVLDRRGVNGRYFSSSGRDVAFKVGSTWSKKYDHYFAMPMEMWEQMYLPEINQLIKERREKAERESKMERDSKEEEDLQSKASSSISSGSGFPSNQTN